MKYLENKPLEIFPYPFTGNYLPEEVVILSDPVNGMKYVMNNGKKLYFRKGWTNSRIRKSWSELMKEQDPESPHRYLTDDFFPSEEEDLHCAVTYEQHAGRHNYDECNTGGHRAPSHGIKRGQVIFSVLYIGHAF